MRKQKIFSIVNMVHIILTIVFFAARFYYSPFINDTPVLIGIIFIFTIIVFNCLNNIRLIAFYEKGQHLKLSQKIFFWVISILFCGTTLLFSYTSYTNIIYLAEAKEITSISLISLFGIFLLFFFNITSLYISVYQFLFFYVIRKNSRESALSIVDQIGQPGQTET